MSTYPYPLIPTPPGDWKNSLYDLHAIRMAAIHNLLIRSFNSIIYHAPNVTHQDVPSFMKYCLVVAEQLHEHHTTEETTVFPFFEAKLGTGAMESNVTQHHDFVPKFNEWSELCAKILAKEAEYHPTSFVSLLRESTDVLHAHLVDEIPTMESSLLQKHFSEAELLDLETRIEKKVQEQATLRGAPLMLVNSDVEFNSWFPPIPAPIMFIFRHVVMRMNGDVWKYAQCDKYMRLKDEFRSMYGLPDL